MFSMTPLHYSSQNCDLKIIQCLINHGAEINSKTVHGNK